MTERVESAKGKTSRLQTACLFLCSIALSLVLAELIARHFVKIPEMPKVFVHEKSENPKLLYKPAPHTSTVAYNVENKINRDGFRDRDFPVEKKEGVKRIIFLGDSIIYGYSLEANQTIPRQLEAVFQEEGKAVEVLNLGVSGYETEQEVEFFKEVGRKYKPDVVLVGVSLNDCHYASWELDLFDNLAHATVKDTKGNGYQKLLGFLYTHSRFFYLLDHTFQIQKKVKELRSDYVPIRRYFEKRNRENKDLPDSPYGQLEKKIVEEATRLGTSKGSLDYLMKAVGFWTDDLYSSHWSISRRSFIELKTLSEKYHFKVVVAIIPVMQEMDRYPLQSLHEFLSSEFKSWGFSVIDMMSFGKEIYRRYGRPAISSDGIHFSKLATPLAGRYLHSELLKIGELDLLQKK